jgi:hypothetical protein
MPLDVTHKTMSKDLVDFVPQGKGRTKGLVDLLQQQDKGD